MVSTVTHRPPETCMLDVQHNTSLIINMEREKKKKNHIVIDMVKVSVKRILISR